MTRGPDLTLLTGFGDEEAYVRTLLSRYGVRISDAAAFALRHRTLLLTTGDGIGIDISLAALPFEQSLVARATEYRFAPGFDLRTCSAEDLLVLKLFASRPLDVRDAEGIVLRNRASLDWRYVEEQLRPLADLKADPAILETLARLRRL